MDLSNMAWWFDQKTFIWSFIMNDDVYIVNTPKYQMMHFYWQQGA